MLFYGDIDRFVKPSSLRGVIAETIGRAVAAAPGRTRHEVLVRALIASGELVQGLTDLEFEEKGADDPSDMREAGAGFLLMLARVVGRSWSNGFSGDLGLPGDWRAMLGRLDGSGPVRLRRGEGYAFYCLYPENYIEAAARSDLLPGTVVIGLRSIGTSLAALVAATIGSHSFFTLRPAGHPFDRQLAVTSRLAEKIVGDTARDFAIVDEGPGLSGSSFGCVAEWLIGHGVAPRRIHFFPGHGGKPGPRASAAHRALWERQARHVVGFDDACGRDLRSWAAGLAGGRPQLWQDISGGGWRARRYASPLQWPPVHAAMERRKFLMRADNSDWLVKFAGLDDLAHRRLKARAALTEAGFAPQYAGAAYGFLIETWVPPPRSDIAGRSGDDADHIGCYLGFRARHLPAPQGGASLSELRAMAIFNTGQALGTDAAEILRKRLSGMTTPARGLRRADTDNRLHRWEWLPTGEGEMLKADAIDHCAAHDFIGCQDVAWDIAGAAVEFDFPEEARTRLAAAVMAEADADHTPDTLLVFEFCYLAFQIGLWTHARMAASGDEAARIDGALKRYAGRLRRLLAD